MKASTSGEDGHAKGCSTQAETREPLAIWLVVEDQSCQVAQLPDGLLKEVRAIHPLHLNSGNDIGPFDRVCSRTNQDNIRIAIIFNLAPVKRLPLATGFKFFVVQGILFE